MRKMEGTEAWEIYGQDPTEEEKQAAADRHASALEAVQGEIIAHASTLSTTYESEDGEEPATMQDLFLAVNTARTEELESFLKQKRVKRLFFEDGYLAVRF